MSAVLHATKWIENLKELVEEAEVELENKQYEVEVYHYGLVRVESDGGSLHCWEARGRPASLATVLMEDFLCLLSEQVG